MSGSIAGNVKHRPPYLQDRALDLIGQSSDGLLQSDLRKILGIDSSTCSKIVRRLLGSGLISRERPSIGNRSTYLLRLNWSSRPRGGSLLRNIDSYLTEIYLLYLIRGSSN